jgi:hypothetical protein
MSERCGDQAKASVLLLGLLQIKLLVHNHGSWRRRKHRQVAAFNSVNNRISLDMGDINVSDGQDGAGSGTKKHILINAFDMSTVGHLSPGQWKVC